MFARGGVSHLLLEIIAYAADEAEAGPAGWCVISRHRDGSVSVADNGRGTDACRDERGRPLRKPVMATKDLRFFDAPEGQYLPDGHRRRGASTVTALSTWLIHTSLRTDGAWTQCTSTADRPAAYGRCPRPAAPALSCTSSPIPT